MKVLLIKKLNLTIFASLLLLACAIQAMNIDQATQNLFTAITSRKTQVAQDLITAGASVNTADSNGKTPLIIASATFQTKTTQFLLEAGADRNLANHDNKIPLYFAAHYNYQPIVASLLTPNFERNTSPDYDKVATTLIQLQNKNDSNACTELIKTWLIENENPELK